MSGSDDDLFAASDTPEGVAADTSASWRFARPPLDDFSRTDEPYSLGVPAYRETGETVRTIPNHLVPPREHVGTIPIVPAYYLQQRLRQYGHVDAKSAYLRIMRT